VLILVTKQALLLFFIKDSFGNVEVQKIADFIEETRFYKQL